MKMCNLLYKISVVFNFKIFNQWEQLILTWANTCCSALVTHTHISGHKRLDRFLNRGSVRQDWRDGAIASVVEKKEE
jgi:hypothetical protein